jgi:hypothetical protein
MKKFYVSMTEDLLGVYIEYTADSERAVRLYLEKHYLREGVWKLPWCAVYSSLPVHHTSLPQIVVQPQCGEIWEEDYTVYREGSTATHGAACSDEEMAAECQRAQPRDRTVIGITKAQQQALKRIYDRGSYDDLSYLAFRRRAQPGPGCIMMPFAGMVLGIEPDGYTHS